MASVNSVLGRLVGVNAETASSIPKTNVMTMIRTLLSQISHVRLLNSACITSLPTRAYAVHRARHVTWAVWRTFLGACVNLAGALPTRCPFRPATRCLAAAGQLRDHGEQRHVQRDHDAAHRH